MSVENTPKSHSIFSYERQLRDNLISQLSIFWKIRHENIGMSVRLALDAQSPILFAIK